MSEKPHWLLKPEQAARRLGITNNPRTARLSLLALLTPGQTRHYPEPYITAFIRWLKGVQPTSQLSRAFATTPIARRIVATCEKRFEQELIAMTVDGYITRAAITKLLNVTHPAVIQWTNRGCLPRDYAMQGRELYRVRVSEFKSRCLWLRPDA